MSPAPRQSHDHEGQQLILHNILCCQCFLNTVFCVFTSATCTLVSYGSGDKKRKTMTLEMKLKITAQLYINVRDLIMFKVG